MSIAPKNGVILKVKVKKRTKVLFNNDRLSRDQNSEKSESKKKVKSKTTIEGNISTNKKSSLPKSNKGISYPLNST